MRSDAERATLGEIGDRLGRKVLAEVATVARQGRMIWSFWCASSPGWCFVDPIRPPAQSFWLTRFESTSTPIWRCAGSEISSGCLRVAQGTEDDACCCRPLRWLISVCNKRLESSPLGRIHDQALDQFVCARLLAANVGVHWRRERDRAGPSA